MENLLPYLTLGGVASILTIFGVLWNAIRKLATTDDVREQVTALRVETREERRVLHDRIDKIKQEYQRADQQQASDMANHINTLDRHLNGRLDSIDRHVSQIVEAMLKG